MARPTPELIDALRTTAKQLRTDVQYYWSHQGSCNCGHLAQTITKLSKAQIHSIAIERHGDWDDHAEDYCPTSGHHLDSIITQMLEMGLERSDIGDLERLSNTKILSRLPLGARGLQYNKREDVILYMETWASMLEEELLASISIENLQQTLSEPVLSGNSESNTRSSTEVPLTRVGEDEYLLV